jgi:hypothetical protein
MVLPIPRGLKPQPSVKEPQAAIERYIAEHNKKPKPFVWTASAGLISKKLKQLCLAGGIPSNDITLLPLFLFFFGVLLVPGFGDELSPAADRVSGWRGDIDFLQVAISREHYTFKTNPLPELFQQRASELKASVPQFSDERIFAELERLMATLGDGHSMVYPTLAFVGKSPLQELPLRFHGFSDGMFVIDAAPGLEKWIGRRVVRLGLVPAQDALRRVAEYIPKDNIQSVRWKGPVFLGFRGPLEAVGCVAPKAGEISLTFAGENGDPEVARFQFGPMDMANQSKLVPSRLPGAGPVPLHLMNLTSNFWFKDLPDRGALYFQFNQVLDSPAESLAAFSASLETALRQSKARLLVVDVRYNAGGNADLFEPLLNALKAFENSTPSGQLVALIGPYTFSAAQIFVTRLSVETKVIFAGEPSGSKPNFVGEENPVKLPWSGLIANISNRYHEIIPGDERNWIEPQLRVEVSSKDYFANRDPALEKVLERFAVPQQR